MLPQIVLDLFFGDTVARHDFRVFDAERDQRRTAAKASDIKMTNTVMHADHFSQRGKRLIAAVAGRMNRQKPINAENGHRALLGLETELDVVGLPWALFLVFAKAHGVLARPTERRA